MVYVAWYMLVNYAWLMSTKAFFESMLTCQENPHEHAQYDYITIVADIE